MSVYFTLYKILLMEKMFSYLEDYKRHLEKFFAQKDRKFFRRQNCEVIWKMTEDSGTKWWICHSIKFLVKVKNVFYFYLKNQRRFLSNSIFLGFQLSSDSFNNSCTGIYYFNHWDLKTFWYLEKLITPHLHLFFF